MPNYRRLYVPGGTVFITIVTRNRRPILTGSLARQFLHHAIATELRNAPFELLATVLLPDHLHAIWSLPVSDSNYSLRWWRIKRQFTMNYLDSGMTEANQSTGKTLKGERGIWQSRFWEHMIRDEDELKRCIDYIHWNPVKHGFVARPCDYPWSTFRKFVKLGEYEPLWGTGAVIEDVPGAEWE